MHAQRLTVNGVSLAVEVRGEGPAILFVHGYPFDRTIWRDQIDRSSGYRRIAPDLRGMGRSDAPDLGYGIDDLRRRPRRAARQPWASTRWCCADTRWVGT